MKRIVVVLLGALLVMPVLAHEGGKQDVSVVQQNSGVVLVKKTDRKKRINKRRKRACHRWARKSYAG